MKREDIDRILQQLEELKCKTQKEVEELLGMGVGFVTLLSGHFHSAFWPLLVATFLFSYLGIMYGRQHVKLRPRRWMVVSAVILIVTAIAAVVNAN